MKVRPPPGVSAAALLLTLVLVALIALVVVSLFAVSRQEVSRSGTTAARVRADLAEEAAFADAVTRLRDLTGNDHYLVTLGQIPGDPSAARYTFISTPGPEDLRHAPLFAGGLELRIDTPAIDAAATEDLATAPIAAPSVEFSGPARDDAIVLPRLTELSESGALVEQNPRPALGFVELPNSGESNWRTRYTYWIEDLEGYPNLDRVGAWPGSEPGPESPAALRLGYAATDSRVLASKNAFPLAGGSELRFQFPTSYRGQRLVDQVAPGLSPREILLQTWAIPGFPDARHPFRGAEGLARERNDLVGQRHRLVGDPHREPDRYASGLRPYRVVPRIPYGHGYPDEGRPRYNLNRYLPSHDLALAEVVERNLPSFAERRGGFPPDEDYVGTLAANALDYADEDGLPTTPANASNAGSRVFRGVDAYCPVNEFFLRFEYVGYEAAGATDRLIFEATPSAEFWNPSNRPAVMEAVRLRFRFLDRLRFLANSVWHEIPDEAREIDNAFPPSGGLDFTVPPNHFHVVEFGKIRWKVEIPRPPQVAFPIVQDLRGVSSSSVRAHYELHLGDVLVDRCGRPAVGEDPATPSYGFFFSRYPSVLASGEFFMRLAVPGLAVKAHGFAAGFGSHLGDPWMSHYSRSTVEDAQYRLKATPGFRNFDHDKVEADQRPDWFKDQTRVRDWPDRGYDAELSPESSPDSDAEAPRDFNQPALPEAANFAPWRLSNLGRFHSVTELGNLHDPAMWIPRSGPLASSQSEQRFEVWREAGLKSLPLDAPPGPMWGGGNTLRIGRPEHALFDRPGMRASQWLDLFHAGFAGSNLGPEEGLAAELLYRHHEPRDHQPPPSAFDPVESVKPPSSLLYDPELHAQGRYTLVHGHLNLNTAPTRFEIETLLRGPSTSGDIRLKSDRHDTPEYEREGQTGILRSALREDSIPLVAEGLRRARPFLGPSHFARVFSCLLERHGALPEHHNDAEAEETFARLFNTTTLSSRHFRIHTSAEVYHVDSGEVVGRRRRVREIFLRPIRDGGGEIEKVVAELLSTREGAYQ